MPSTRNTPKRGAGASADTKSPAQKGKQRATSSARVGRPKKSASTTAPAPSSSNKRGKKNSGKSGASTSTQGKHQAQNDEEILTSFRLFAVQRPEEDEDEEYEDDDGDDGEGVIPITDVRRCLAAVNLPPAPRDFFDRETRYLSWSHFLELAQTLRDTQDDDDDGDDDDDDVNMRDAEEAAEAQAEVDSAFTLFIHGSSGDAAGDRSLNAARITLADLKRVARELRENVDEKTLKLMIEEANGETGKESIERGVGRGDFEAVMRRAGVFGS